MKYISNASSLFLNFLFSSKISSHFEDKAILVCKDYKTKELVPNTCCCSMCKRMVINAGIKQVVIRDTNDDFRIIDVNDWILNDESLTGIKGY